MSLKSALLKPDMHVEKRTLFGAEVNLIRLTVGQLDHYDREVRAATEAGDFGRVSVAGANLILSAICDENGKPLKASDLPTAKQLIDAHSNAAFLTAMKALQQYCYGTVEDAKKN